MKKKFIIALPFIIYCFFILLFYLYNKNKIPILLDSSIFLSKIEANRHFFTMWDPDNLGYLANLKLTTGFFSFLFSFLFWNIFPTSSFTIMYSLYYLLIFNLMFYISWLYIYKSLSFIKLKPLFISFIVTAFYNFNTFTVFLTGGGVIDGMFTVVFLLPLYGYYLLKSRYQKLQINDVLLLALATGLCINIFPYSFAVILVLGIAFSLTQFSISLRSLRYAFIFIITSVLVGSVFIASMLSGIDFKNKYDPQGSGLNNFIFLPKGIVDAFRLIFDWFSNTNVRFSFDSFYFIQISPLGTIGIFLIWILCFVPLLKNKIKQINKLWFNSICIILITALFLVKGGSQPFSSINYWLYSNIPFFGMFRTPGTKFGLLIFYSLSMLIGYQLLSSRNKVYKVLLLLLVIFQIIPYFVKHPRFSLLSPTENSVKIANEQNNLIDFINKLDNQSRILFLPGHNTTCYQFGSIKYTGSDIIGRSIKLPALYEDGFAFPEYNNKYMDMTNKLDSNALGNLSVKYILLRNDYCFDQLPGFKKQKESYKQLISKQLVNKKYHKIFQSKNYELYEIDISYFKPIIYIKNNDKFYYPTVQSNSPYKYSFSIPKELINNQTIISLNNIYYPYWQIISSENNSVSTFHYNDKGLNAWSLKKIDKNLSPKNEILFTIYYGPQKTLVYGLIISSISIVFVIFFLIRKKKSS